jgi:hypothetical protein
VDEKQARIQLDDIVALLNNNPAHVLGAEPVQRFVEQVYIPEKYEDGDWRKASGQAAEYLFRRSILPEIGGLHCRDLKAEHLRTLMRKLAGTDLRLRVGQQGQLCDEGYDEEDGGRRIPHNQHRRGPKDAKNSEAGRSFPTSSRVAGGVRSGVDGSR